MFSLTRQNNTFAVILLLSTWMIFAGLYTWLRGQEALVSYAGIQTFIAEVLLNIIGFIISWKLFLNTSSREKYLFILFALSFLCALFADGSYNLLLNVFHISEFSSLVASIYEIPFLGFLLFQLLAWIVIFMTMKKVIFTWQTAFIYIPLTIISLMILAIFLIYFPWEITLFSVKGVYHFLDTVLEVSLFIFVMLCLITSNKRSIFYMGLGLLIIVGSDFIIRFSALDNALIPEHPSECTWVLGQLLLVYGFSVMLKNGDHKNPESWLSSINSIKSQCAAWCFILCLFSLTAFFLTNYIFTGGDTFLGTRRIPELPTTIIVFSILSIVASNLLAKQLLVPFQKIETLVHLFMQSKSPTSFALNTQYNILEFSNLDQCFSKAFILLREKINAEKYFSNTVIQLAHDIRSPLAALDTISNEVTCTSEEERNILKNVTRRINDLANDVLAKYKDRVDEHSFPPFISDKLSSELISEIVDQIVSEKRIEYNKKPIVFNLKTQHEAQCLFIKINLLRFKCVLSNIINNAVEAIEEEGSIKVIINKTSDFATIDIIDDGHGIPSQEIPNIITGKIGKHPRKGTGLGIPTANEYIKSWKGELKIQSPSTTGTKVSIGLPIMPAADWFKPAICIPYQAEILIIDDDPLIHNVWEMRFSEYKEIIQYITNLKNPNDLLSWNKQRLENQTLYLIDYEFINSNLNGIDIITKLDIAKKSILVTSHFNDKEIRKRCKEIGVKLIPKRYVAYIPIHFMNKNVDLIFIDDDPDMTTAWQFKGKRKNINILTFNTAHDFLNVIDAYDTSIPIYIDSHLGDYHKGEDIAKVIFEKGFKTIYLTTGYTHINLTSFPWIKGIVKKTPPF